MKVSLRKLGIDGWSQLIYDKKLDAKSHMEYMPINLDGNSAIYKHGRLLDIKYIPKIDGISKGEMVITLTESEVFQLAKRCRRRRSDREFIDLIMSQDLGSVDKAKNGNAD